MSPRPAPRRGQHGIVLIALLAVILLGSSWLLLSKLNVSAAERVAAKRERNAAVLNQAKQALIGYVVAQANKAGENNPGNIPCPENPGDFDSATGRQGLVGSGCDSSVKVGRFPWRTLGIDKLVDADGEPLWYVVSPNWGGSNTYINSNSVGNLTVDGVANAAVALIIAPGPVINATSAGGCTAWSQVRALAGTPDWRNYLECDNATSPADTSFITSAPANGVFNDQVMVVKAEEVLPGLEAAIANRVQREIVPLLNTVYDAAGWGLSGSNPLYPYPAPFAAPGPGVGSSSYQGVAGGSYSGLLPLNQTQGCTVSASDPRCTTTFLAFSKASGDAQTAGSGSIRTDSTCSWVSDVYTCTGQYNQPSLSLNFKLKVSNVAMGLRTVDSTKVTCSAIDDVGAGLPTQTVPCSISSKALQSDGSAILTIAVGPTPDIVASGWGTYANYTVKIDRAVMADHSLVSASDPDTGWFVRNDWFRLTYYAVARGDTASSSSFPSMGCTTGGSGSSACLTISSADPANPITPAGGQRAILVLAGRPLSTLPQSRPAIGSSDLAQYFEGANAGGTSPFERRIVARSVTAFNDRVVVVGSN